MSSRSVVTAFLRNDGDVLLLRRSDEVGSFAGKWAAVSGYAEGNPDSQVRREIREETGIAPETCELVTAGDSFTVTDSEDRTWRVHPYLFDCPVRSVETDWESTAHDWVAPTEMLDRETVPDLWESYDRVRPTVETIESDTEHGSAYISRLALAVLRDEAALLAREHDTAYDSIEAVGSALLDTRPAMTVVRNRINRVLFEVSEGATRAIEPAGVESVAHEAITSALEDDQAAAGNLATEIDGERVATLSRSGTVLAAMRERPPEAVLLPESRPGREGVAVAERLADETDVTLTTDAAFAHQLVAWEADLFVVGADTVFPDGTLSNKVGTRSGALSASDAGIPVLVGTATDKISHDDTVDLEERSVEELYSGPESVAVRNPTFDLTPSDAIDRFVTERGPIAPSDVEGVAAAHERHAGWRR